MSGLESAARPLTFGAEKQPHVLTIAGSDSSGGAGIQADLKTFSAFECYGASVLTGLTAQNTTGVQGVHPIPTSFVLQQLDSVFNDDIPISIKFGMLTSAETIKALTTCPHLTDRKAMAVLDPVMISTSGHVLLPDDAIEALKGLFGIVDWLTPNIPEAEQLAGLKQGEGAEGLVELAKKTAEVCNVPIVLLKGGHSPILREQVNALKGYKVIWEEGDDEGDTIECLSRWRKLVVPGDKSDKVVLDILVQKGSEPVLFVGKYVESSSTHGTGCTLSSAIAASYAKLPEDQRGTEGNIFIAKTAVEYVRSAISTAFPMGSGHGPLNHSHLTTKRALPQPTKSNPHPFVSHLIQSDLPLWKSYVRSSPSDIHEEKLMRGPTPICGTAWKGYTTSGMFRTLYKAGLSLPTALKGKLIVDARAHSLGAYKSSTFEDMQAFTEIALHITRESAMHVQYCSEFNITLPQLLRTPESSTTSAYARYILDIGTQSDILELYVAIAACLIGYGEVGLWLQKQVALGKAKVEGNIYKRWMEDYGGEDFLGAVDRGIENLERRVAAERPSPERLERLTYIWHEVVRLERNFWQMGLDLS